MAKFLLFLLRLDGFIGNMPVLKLIKLKLSAKKFNSGSSGIICYSYEIFMLCHLRG